MAAFAFTATDKVKEKDPNILDPDRPATRFKDNENCYWSQDNKVFSNGGQLIVGPESSKADIWNLMQKPMGRLAVERSKISVIQADALRALAEAKTVDPVAAPALIFACKVCNKEFVHRSELSSHMYHHKVPGRNAKNG